MGIKEIFELIKLLVPLIMEIIKLISKTPKQAVENVMASRKIVKETSRNL